MCKSVFPLSEVYGLLEPGPVVLMSTQRAGRANVMAQSWLTMIEFEPPLLGFVLSERNYSFAALQATGECVINIPTREILDAVVGCGNCSGAECDKFERFSLSAQAASRVGAPMIRECFASLECRVVDRSLVQRYGFFVLEVLAAWLDADMPRTPTLHHRGHGAFMLAGPTVQTGSQMP
jgi:flavin reductase (DIM6/NTAB) family NADH-FMN oxidoreductase RutF